MKKALKIVFMMFCFVVGLLLATFYKELVGLTGNVGFVIATLGGVVAVLSAIILLVGTFHALKHRVMIR
jgi:hypothetical protein